MTGRIPPKSPPPQFGDITHYSVELLWGDYIDRLREVFDVKVDGRLITEAQQKPCSKTEWHTVYSGYAKKINSRDLESETMYDFRIRFKNKNGLGEWSDSASVRTKKPPLTGEHLHKAIRFDDEVELERILQLREANIEATDNLGFTPLMAAAQKGQANIIRLLIKYHVNLETKHESGKTALMLSAYRGKLNCIETLLENGANIENTDKSGLVALHYAVDGEQLGAVRLLISKNANINAKDNVVGWTPLLRCAGLKNNGNSSIALELLRSGAHVDEQDNDGKTALHNAVLNGHAKLCELLINSGASLEMKTHSGYTAVALAESLEQRAVRAVFADFFAKKGIEVLPGTLTIVKSKLY